MIRAFGRRISKRTQPYRVPTTRLGPLLIRWAGLYGIFLGLFILFGGDVRWNSSPYISISHWMPRVFWACVPICLGILIILGSLTKLWWIKAAGFGVLCLWTSAFAVGSLQGLFLTPDSSPTVVPTYIFVTGILIGLIFTDEGQNAEAT